MSDPKWVRIEDSRIRHVWENSEGQKTTVSPDWYAENGTPMDPELDEDLIYSHTEINTGDV